MKKIIVISLVILVVVAIVYFLVKNKKTDESESKTTKNLVNVQPRTNSNQSELQLISEINGGNLVESFKVTQNVLNKANATAVKSNIAKDV